MRSLSAQYPKSSSAASGCGKRGLAARCLISAIALSVAVMIANGASAGDDWQFIDLIVTFNMADIDRPPVIDGTTFRIDCTSKSTSVGALTHVIWCKQLRANRLSPEYSIAGPWAITVFSSEDPELLLQNLIQEPSVATAMLQEDVGATHELLLLRCGIFRHATSAARHRMADGQSCTYETSNM